MVRHWSPGAADYRAPLPFGKDVKVFNVIRPTRSDLRPMCNCWQSDAFNKGNAILTDTHPMGKWHSAQCSTFLRFGSNDLESDHMTTRDQRDGTVPATCGAGVKRHTNERHHSVEGCNAIERKNLFVLRMKTDNRLRPESSTLTQTTLHDPR